MINQIDPNVMNVQAMQKGPRPLHNLKPINPPEEKKDQNGNAVAGNAENLQAQLKSKQAHMPKASEMMDQRQNPNQPVAQKVNILA